MRHRVVGKSLSRSPSHRRAMLRNMAASLFEHGEIRTTRQKAREVRRFAEKLITLAKRGDLASRQLVIARLHDRYIVDADETDVTRDKWGRVKRAPRVVKRLFDDIAPQYKDRDGGYTRIIPLPTRRIGDEGEVVILQLVGREQAPKGGARRGSAAARRRRKAQDRIRMLSTLLGKSSQKQSADAAGEAADEAEQVADAPAPEAEAADTHDTPEAEAPTENQDDQQNQEQKS